MDGRGVELLKHSGDEVPHPIQSLSNMVQVQWSSGSPQGLGWQFEYEFVGRSGVGICNYGAMSLPAKSTGFIDDGSLAGVPYSLTPVPCAVNLSIPMTSDSNTVIGLDVERLALPEDGSAYILVHDSMTGHLINNISSNSALNTTVLGTSTSVQVGLTTCLFLPVRQC